MKQKSQRTTCYTCLNMNLLKLRFPKTPRDLSEGKIQYGIATTSFETVFPYVKQAFQMS